MDRLSGKKSLVIGAASGIGREVCRLFAREGADVAVADHAHDADAAHLVDEFRAGSMAGILPEDAHRAEATNNAPAKARSGLWKV